MDYYLIRFFHQSIFFLNYAIRFFHLSVKRWKEWIIDNPNFLPSYARSGKIGLKTSFFSTIFLDRVEKNDYSLKKNRKGWLKYAGRKQQEQ